MAITRLVTAEDLEQMADQGRYELIEGELHELAPTDWPHGTYVLNLGGPLGQYTTEHDIGRVAIGDVGVILSRDPDTVFGPDIVFVKKERLPTSDEEEFLRIVPDLAVEVISPSNRPGEVSEKVERYLAAGVPVVWLVEPRPRTVTVCSADGSRRVLTEDEVLDGGDLLPGFRLLVADIFR